MKALFVLALLSMVSTAQAYSGVDLVCTADGASAHSITTLKKEGKNFTMITAYHTSTGVKKSVTTLFVDSSSKNIFDETEYEGIAETRNCIDGCEDRQKFSLRVPQDLQNEKANLVLEDDSGDGMEVVADISFKCSRPDNR